MTDDALPAFGLRPGPGFDDEFDVDAHRFPPRCEHPSSSGIDQTPVDDPQKVWHCHSCEAHHLADGTRILAPEIEERWVNFWAEMVTRSDGTIDVAQVKAELHDYWTCIEEVPKVYMDVTGGTLSKPNYLAREVISVHDEDCPNVTALIEEIREVLDGRGDHDDLPRREDAATVGEAAALLADRFDRLEEILMSHETLHSSMYREEREKATQ